MPPCTWMHALALASAASPATTFATAARPVGVVVAPAVERARGGVHRGRARPRSARACRRRGASPPGTNRSAGRTARAPWRSRSRARRCARRCRAAAPLVSTRPVEAQLRGRPRRPPTSSPSGSAPVDARGSGVSASSGRSASTPSTTSGSTRCTPSASSTSSASRSAGCSTTISLVVALDQPDDDVPGGGFGRDPRRQLGGDERARARAPARAPRTRGPPPRRRARARRRPRGRAARTRRCRPARASGPGRGAAPACLDVAHDVGREAAVAERADRPPGARPGRR